MVTVAASGIQVTTTSSPLRSWQWTPTVIADIVITDVVIVLTDMVIVLTDMAIVITDMAIVITDMVIVITDMSSIYGHRYH